MSSWLKENVKYETDLTRSDLLNGMFTTLSNYLKTTKLIQTCDDESLRESFISHVYKFYTLNNDLSVKLDENHDWIDQLYSEGLSEIFREFLRIDDFFLTEIFKYKTFDKIVDFVSIHFVYEEDDSGNDDSEENNFYQNIDEERV
tara:strand:+ start:3726 stop:4160 length:435 start_codon:yes stop_codon:yes gene_type:complete